MGHILRRQGHDNRRLALQWASQGKRKEVRHKETKIKEHYRMEELVNSSKGICRQEYMERNGFCLSPTRGDEDR